jgi:ADP-ribose pyrophosphatase YjhB (NUDIX family)
LITFTQDGIRFTYRIVGVAMDRGRVLLHRAETDGFWALPGGRGELLETAATTLRREMCEELGVEVEVGRLLWVVENFFRYAGADYHELALYFLMNPPMDWPRRWQSEPFDGQEGHLRLVFRWFPLAALEAVPLYPTFLRQALQALPAMPEHVVHTDQ